jgi:thioredoxin-dependent peroxiredoxin
MAQLEAGNRAPDFNLPADNGETFSLSAHAGKPVVLFFYPKDDTSGCTAEAADFTRKLDDFNKLGVVVAGMSPDTIKSHEKFREKHSLDVILISDQEKTTLQAYDVWKEKSMYGRKFMGVERTTFLIDGEGMIRRIWRKVSVPGHVDDVLSQAEKTFG